jgi:hypothetical protein
MKRLRYNTWVVLLAAGFLFITLSGSTQDSKEGRKERKEQRKAELLANFNALDTVLNERGFVLEADFLINYYGYRFHVPSTINFIKVDSSKCVLQTGSDFRFGYNGVGGITAEGNIGSWKLEKNLKNLSYNLHFNVVTQIGNYDVFMTVTADNHAQATITGLTAGRLTWDGHLAALYNSRVYKGLNTI